MTRPLAAVVLAAGKGTRMNSDLPKVLHEVSGKTMLDRVLDALEPLEPDPLIVIVGHRAETVKASVAERGVRFVHQRQMLGTGHALLQAKSALETFTGHLLVVNGDAPLLTTASLRRLLDKQRETGADMTLLTYEVEDASGFGRIVRSADGSVEKIVEHKDASPEELELREVNPGFFLFNDRVFDLASRLSNDNASGEYLITDLVDLYLQSGGQVQAVVGEDATRHLVGVNTREQLAVAERLLGES